MSWIHYAVSYNGLRSKFYINGTESLGHRLLVVFSWKTKIKILFYRLFNKELTIEAWVTINKVL